VNFISNNKKSAVPEETLSLPVISGFDFTVTDGVNLGDSLQDASALLHDDHYQISRNCDLQSIVIIPAPKHSLTNTMRQPDYLIAPSSTVGQSKNGIFLDSVITLMAPDGKIVDALIMVEVAQEHASITSTYLLPMTEITPRTPYRLIGIDCQNPQKFFAHVACVSLTRGTSITMDSGMQRKVEDLSLGDRILTRDSGAQEIRWIGETTRRAEGSFAPILIKKGALNNSEDLIVSPSQRLFFWQRVDLLGLGRSEVMVQARHLVNGDTIRIVEGGYIDYFQILFDDHQIIYAEGIATESMLLGPSTSPALPEDLCLQLAKNVPTHNADSPRAYEEGTAELGGTNMADRLKRASSPR